MPRLILQPRLRLLADLTPQGTRLADVGTDHGYLPVFLLQEGRICSAIASDVNAEPLEHARRTAREYEVSAIEFRLCSGLEAIAPSEVDTVVIAGMGGEPIADILLHAPWTREGKTLLLQPMTKAEELRRFLSENGYAIAQEHLVRDKGHIYTVLTVRGGVQVPLSEAEQYAGVGLFGDALYGDYLRERINKLNRAADGLRRSGEANNLLIAREKERLARELEQKEKEWRDGNGS